MDIEFESYIRGSEPDKKEKASAWKTAMNLKDRENFMENYLSPAIKDRFIVMLYPDNPKHPHQKYLLTTKGLSINNSKS